MTGQKPEHESDGWGGLVHIDIDPVIPTGICAICSWEPPYVEPSPEPEPEPQPEPEPGIVTPDTIIPG